VASEEFRSYAPITVTGADEVANPSLTAQVSVSVPTKPGAET